jgi:NAD(P)-dependent dehydrogenase (short-subunit alcohol dehydrogenase family)
MTSDAPVCVVAGASRGIGAAGALALAKAGYRVIACARSQKALEALDDQARAGGQSLTLVPLDLKDGAAIDQLGAALFERHGRIDALLVAAGVLGGLSPVGHVRPQTWDNVIATNLTAAYRLIRSLDPLMRAASPAGRAPARALFVTSNVATDARAFWGPYAASKAGLEALVKSYAAETDFLGMRVNLLNPGGVATRMRAEAFPGEDPASLPRPEALAPMIVRMLAAGWGTTGQVLSFRETEDLKAWAAAQTGVSSPTPAA